MARLPDDMTFEDLEAACEFHEYWRRNQDFWVGTGELVQWFMGSFA